MPAPDSPGRSAGLLQTIETRTPGPPKEKNAACHEKAGPTQHALSTKLALSLHRMKGITNPRTSATPTLSASTIQNMATPTSQGGHQTFTTITDDSSVEARNTHSLRKGKPPTRLRGGRDEIRRSKLPREASTERNKEKRRRAKVSHK